MLPIPEEILHKQFCTSSAMTDGAFRPACRVSHLNVNRMLEFVFQFAWLCQSKGKTTKAGAQSGMPPPPPLLVSCRKKGDRLLAGLCYCHAPVAAIHLLLPCTCCCHAPAIVDVAAFHNMQLMTHNSAAYTKTKHPQSCRPPTLQNGGFEAV